MSTTPRPHHAWILGSLAAAAAIALALQPAIAQDPAYHRFADTRPVLGIPHGWNVFSNAPFLLVGVIGLWRCRRCPSSRHAWLVAFAGIALVALGSAWYHHAPSGDSLMWDRVPMTIGFMGLLTAILEPRIGSRAARLFLGPAVVAGVASVGYWQWTGDLRAYVWVQFTPLLLIGAVVALDRHHPSTAPLLAALVLYGAAKGLEAADAAIFAVTGGLTAGHAWKHLAAAAACLALVRVAERSGRVPESDRRRGRAMAVRPRSLQGEAHRDGHDRRDGGVVDDGRLVAPLRDGRERRHVEV